MNILYLCHRIPFPPDKGEKIRAYHLLRALSAVHDVDLFTLADEPGDLAHAAGLAPYCRHVDVFPLHRRMATVRALPYLATSKPLTVPYFASRQLLQAVKAAVTARSYDRVFVYCSAMVQYAGLVNAPTVLDLVDVDSDKWLQYAGRARFPFSAVYRREAHCLRRYERAAMDRAAAVLVTTEREAGLARAIAPAAPLHVLPNGVDTEYFRPADARHAGAPEIVFVGDMGYFPNAEAVIYFAREVLPLVRRTVPGAHFSVVGRNPGPEVRRLAEQQGVHVTGRVPDVRPYLAAATVAVAPFRIAAGIQNKILEAMASAVPVVATPRAAESLTRNVREMVDTATSTAELASRVARWLVDPAGAHERGREGRRRVEADYSWTAAGNQLLDIIEAPCSTKTPCIPKHMAAS